MTIDAVMAWIAAPFVGSFLGLIADRLPADEPVLLARSRCDGCGRALGPLELIPLLSWLWQRGRARCCKAPLRPFYPMIELAALGVALWTSLIVEGWLLWVSCGLGWTLLLLAVIDLRHLWLPDTLNLPLIPAGFAVTWLLAPGRLLEHVAAAGLGFAILALIAMLYRRLRGREGLGLGDVKLMAGAGAWLGPLALPSVLLLGASLALAATLAGRLWSAKFETTTPIAFGPWLALAFWLTWLHGPVQIG